eukprot:229096-Pyramimonas_sp.AAC.1
MTREYSPLGGATLLLIPFVVVHPWSGHDSGTHEHGQVGPRHRQAAAGAGGGQRAARHGGLTHARAHQGQECRPRVERQRVRAPPTTGQTNSCNNKPHV